MAKLTTQDQKLAKLLLRSKKISPEQLNLLKEKAQKTRQPLLKVIQEEQIIPPKELVKIYSKVIGVPFVDLSRRRLSKEYLFKLPEQVARRYLAVVFGHKGNKLKVALGNPQDFPTIEILQKRLGQEIVIYLAALDDIYTVLNQYSGLETEVERAIAQETGEYVIPETGVFEKPAAIEEIRREDSPIANLARTVIEKAVRENASDIHIEPTENQIIIRYRIDGVLTKRLSLRKTILAALVSRIKILANLKIDETRLPQDGQFRSIIDNREIDFRVSTLPTVNGEKVVLRILTPISRANLALNQLGLTGRGLKVLENAIKKPYGMILVCGPTGSGKTTTLYAVLQKLNREGVNIVTLEDPVEYHLEGINQSQINPEINFTFANGLRSILRQDPDIVMIGEIRDFETAEMAVHAALTGHLVLSTLHTNDAAGAIPRLIDMRVEPFLVASALSTIISQRLVRRICESCREEYEAPPEVKADIEKELKGLPEALRSQTKITKSLKLQHGKGCPKCNHTGYRGRIGIFEVLPVDESIVSLVLKQASSNEILEQAKKDGMLTLKQDGVLKVLAGITTIEEVWRVTEMG